MNDRIQKSCLIKLDTVGTCLNRRLLSNAVGTAVLGKKWFDCHFEVISGFVGTVGTVGQENSVPEKRKQWSVIRKEVSDAN